MQGEIGWEEVDGGRRTRYAPEGGRAALDRLTTWVKVHHRGARSEGSTGPARSFWVGQQLVAIAWPVARSETDWWLAMRPMTGGARW